MLKLESSLNVGGNGPGDEPTTTKFIAVGSESHHYTKLRE